eukprot:SAG22_NODE_630_length_8383_cov_5.839469_6_plen_591_part_00
MVAAAAALCWASSLWTRKMVAAGSTRPPGYGWSLDDFPNFLPVPNGQLTNGSQTLPVAPQLRISLNCSSPLLSAAADRYRGTMFAWGGGLGGEPAPAPAALAVLHIEVGDTDETAPQLGMDESYTLDVPAAGGAAILRAPAVWGALRALETFSQLVEYEPATDVYILRKAPWTIVDAGPRMQHRSLMIDTARHWLPTETIKRQIDAVSYSKMNTIHWHAVDSQSFPLELTSFPKLAEIGAYTMGKYKMTYSVAEQEDIVEYARLRGVRIVLELDLPGHSDVWAFGAPPGTFLDCRASPVAEQSAVLDVTSDAAYAFLEQVLAEIFSRFPDRVFHLGGDEVSSACWNRSATVQHWLAAHPAVTVDQLYPRYILKVHQLLKQKFNRSATTWNPGLAAGLNYSAHGTDPARGALPMDAISEQWSDPDINAPLAAGRRVITSLGYYLNSAPTISATERTWEQLYNADPACSNASSPTGCVYNLPAAQQANFLGAEACDWGEATDQFNLDQKTWFRLPAVAERMWTTNANLAARGLPVDRHAVGYDNHDAVARLLKHRCRLLQRGIEAQLYWDTNAFRSKWHQCQGWLPPTKKSL